MAVKTLNFEFLTINYLEVWQPANDSVSVKWIEKSAFERSFTNTTEKEACAFTGVKYHKQGLSANNAFDVLKTSKSAKDSDSSRKTRKWALDKSGSIKTGPFN